MRNLAVVTGVELGVLLHHIGWLLVSFVVFCPTDGYVWFFTRLKQETISLCRCRSFLSVTLVPKLDMQMDGIDNEHNAAASEDGATEVRRNAIVMLRACYAYLMAVDFPIRVADISF